MRSPRPARRRTLRAVTRITLESLAESRRVRLGGALTVLVVTLLALRIHWPTTQAFLEALDHTPYPFWDFQGYYYPQATKILHGEVHPGYIYPAFLAVMLAPLTALPVEVALWFWGALQVAAIIALWLGTVTFLRLRPSGALLAAAITVSSFPVLHVLKWGQVGVLISALVVWALIAQRAGRSVMAGVLIALATVLKLYPAIFVLWFLFRRDWRALIGVIAGGVVAGALIPAVVMGPARWVGFELAVQRQMGTIDWQASNMDPGVAQASQYVVFAVTRQFPGAPVSLLRYAGFACALALVVLAYALSRQPRAVRFGLPIVALMMVVPFVVRTSWPHYFSLLAFAQIAVFGYWFARLEAGRTPAGPALVAGSTAAVSAVLSWVFLTLSMRNWMAYMGGSYLFWANTILALPLVLAVFGEREEQGQSEAVEQISTSQ